MGTFTKGCGEVKNQPLKGGGGGIGKTGVGTSYIMTGFSVKRAPQAGREQEGAR